MEKLRKKQKIKETISNFEDLSSLVKIRFTKHQDDAWKIFISNQNRPKHFQDRFTRAQNNIDFSIELLTYLAKNDLLDDERKARLRKIYIS